MEYLVNKKLRVCQQEVKSLSDRKLTSCKYLIISVNMVSGLSNLVYNLFSALLYTNLFLFYLLLKNLCSDRIQ